MAILMCYSTAYYLSKDIRIIRIAIRMSQNPKMTGLFGQLNSLKLCPYLKNYTFKDLQPSNFTIIMNHIIE